MTSFSVFFPVFEQPDPEVKILTMFFFSISMTTTVQQTNLEEKKQTKLIEIHQSQPGIIFWTQWSNFLFSRSTKMINGSKTRNHWLRRVSMLLTGAVIIFLVLSGGWTANHDKNFQKLVFCYCTSKRLNLVLALVSFSTKAK